MKMVLISVAIILNFHIVYTVASSACNVPSTPSNTPAQYLDYYWRNYVGIIPPDAVPGGRDKAGRTTYIGQVYITNYELLPATIYSGCNSAYTSAYTKELQSDKNVKILCSKNIGNFGWIATTRETAHLITNCHIIVGGSETNRTLHIGRVNYNGETIIGKAFSHPADNSGLWLPYEGRPVQFSSYEMLTYNCVRTVDWCRSSDTATKTKSVE